MRADDGRPAGPDIPLYYVTRVFSNMLTRFEPYPEPAASSRQLYCLLLLALDVGPVSVLGLPSRVSLARLKSRWRQQRSCFIFGGTGFLRLAYRDLSQSPQKNVRLGQPHCGTAPLPSTSFPIHYSLTCPATRHYLLAYYKSLPDVLPA